MHAAWSEKRKTHFRCFMCLILHRAYFTLHLNMKYLVRGVLNNINQTKEMPVRCVQEHGKFLSTLQLQQKLLSFLYQCWHRGQSECSPCGSGYQNSLTKIFNYSSHVPFPSVLPCRYKTNYRAKVQSMLCPSWSL